MYIKGSHLFLIRVSTNPQLVVSGNAANILKLRTFVMTGLFGNTDFRNLPHRKSGLLQFPAKFAPLER